MQNQEQPQKLQPDFPSTDKELPPELLQQIEKGMQQIKEGKVKSLGSFAKYVGL